MNSTFKKLSIILITSNLLFVSSLSSAKQVEIGIGAIAVDSSLVGKGKFVVNDTIDEGDALKTGGEGSTTILFNDESMLTLGPGAHASVEVYEEAKDGKPGRSIIRVHNGQFRYFPGDILENGGAQFIAVGNKLLGKAGAVANAPQNNIGLQVSSVVSNEQSPSTKKSNSNNTGNGNAENSQGNGLQPEGIEETIPTEAGSDAEQKNDQADLDQVAPETGSGNSLKANSIVAAKVGPTSTGEDGINGGSQSFEINDSPLSLIKNQGNMTFGNTAASDTTPITPDTPQGGGVNKLKGITAFITNGLSGTVKNSQGNFSGSVDVFNKSGILIGFLNPTNKKKNAKSLSSANAELDSIISLTTPQAFEATPTYDVPIYTAPALVLAPEPVQAPAPVGPVGPVGVVLLNKVN
ncbi:MAG: hypothetical protein KAT25_02740 [Sulfuriflexus sp.]|nr:hypothetical protein [Sulfuriflexus sp.]